MPWEHVLIVAAPITIPVLAHFLPLTFVLALASVLDLASALVLGFHTRRRADPRELLLLVPFTFLGLALGVTLLVKLPRSITLLALGIFVCLHAFHIVSPPGLVAATQSGMDGAGWRRGRCTRSLWTAVGLLLPAAWIGVWVGHRIQLRVAPATLARVIALALFVTGASLIVRTL